MKENKRGKSNQNIKKTAIRIISTLVLALILIVIQIISDLFPNEVNNYIESDLNIPINETNAIAVSTLESTVVTKDSKLNIYYFDVGQADSELIIAKNEDGTKSVMMIDAGNNEDGNNLVKYIKALDIDRIDYLVGTHAHEDHIGGMAKIIKNFDIGTVYMPNVSTTTRTYENLLTEVSKKGIGISTCNIGDTFSVGSGICTVMNVRNEEQEDLNDTSICLHYVYGQEKFLFMGDASDNMEKDVAWPEVDVLKVAHHGSKTSTSENFLNQVKPKISIISVSKDNIYGHPNQETLERLKSIGSEVYRTDEMGTILLTSDGNTYNIEGIKTDIDGNKKKINKSNNKKY